MINRLPTAYEEAAERAERQASGIDLSALQSWRRDLETLIGNHPAAVLAVSLGAGFLIGWWTKRK